MFRLMIVLLLLFVGGVSAHEEKKPEFGFTLVSVMSLPKEGAQHGESDSPQHYVMGTLITEVECGSSSQRAGIRPGDEIVAINKVSLHGKTVSEFAALMEDLEKDWVTLTLVRQKDGHTYLGEFTIQKSITDGVCQEEL